MWLKKMRRKRTRIKSNGIYTIIYITITKEWRNWKKITRKDCIDNVVMIKEKEKKKNKNKIRWYLYYYLYFTKEWRNWKIRIWNLREWHVSIYEIRHQLLLQVLQSALSIRVYDISLRIAVTNFVKFEGDHFTVTLTQS